MGKRPTTYFVRETEQNFIFAHKAHLQQLQRDLYKLVTRQYRPPAVLAKLSLCWHCGTQTGSVVHIFCDCPVLRHFWQSVLEIIQQETGFDLPNNLEAIVLHFTSTKYL